MSANSNLSAVASSTCKDEQREYPVSNVLDGLYGNNCILSNVYNSFDEENPWLEVAWPGTIIIWRIIIYNRVDCCGEYCLIGSIKKTIPHFSIFLKNQN